MAALDTNTYAWNVDEWNNRDYTYGSAISAQETSDDWEVTLTMSILPSHGDKIIPPDDHTMTAHGNYFLSGCEISLITAQDQILLRRSPSTEFGSSVSTKILTPPAILPRPTSTSDNDAQTTSAADATYLTGSAISNLAASASDSGSPSSEGGAIAELYYFLRLLSAGGTSGEEESAQRQAF
ncbi:hypothetical protein G6011_07111 [Alternaria panax]|uniref:Uncharacterized protein n=1 Tax=Alternaria panax TaxID=48097 RepID=A0AAD4FAB6_9PLEO|nr:hypothetical protein G6011_07111 [Alternaria panax]